MKCSLTPPPTSRQVTQGSIEAHPLVVCQSLLTLLPGLKAAIGSSVEHDTIILLSSTISLGMFHL